MPNTIYLKLDDASILPIFRISKQLTVNQPTKWLVHFFILEPYQRRPCPNFLVLICVTDGEPLILLPNRRSHFYFAFLISPITVSPWISFTSVAFASSRSIMCSLPTAPVVFISVIMTETQTRSTFFQLTSSFHSAPSEGAKEPNISVRRIMHRMNPQ